MLFVRRVDVLLARMLVWGMEFILTRGRSILDFVPSSIAGILFGFDWLAGLFLG